MSDTYDKSPPQQKLPREFFFRRLHSFAGLFFLLFLIEHLFTNSQAAYFLGDSGKGFVEAVNFIHSLPYLSVLEIGFIALPLAIHVWWGIDRMRTAKLNSFTTDGTTPSLAHFSRNQAYSWQRITSVLLIVAIGLHVYYMRFHHQPEEVHNNRAYLVTLSNGTHMEADTIGSAFLMVLQDTYSSLPMCIAYTLFVCIAAFHGCNGLWTFAITWGVALSEGGRKLVRHASNGLMALLIFFGLACIWGIYVAQLR